MFFISATQGWIVGGPTILATTNAGATWTPQTSLPGNYNHVHFISPTNGWATSQYSQTFSNSFLATTNDGGTTWEQAAVFYSTSLIKSIHFISAKQGWVTRTFGNISSTYYTIDTTNDGGVKWSPQFQQRTNIYNLNDAYFVNSGLGWAVGYAGVILKYSATSDINQLRKENDFSFYPNPTSNKINFKTEDRGTLTITNQIGQIVSSFSINESQTQIPTDNLQEGIYMLTFQTETQRITRKLIIQ